jgi:hypothetical protein
MNLCINAPPLGLCLRLCNILIYCSLPYTIVGSKMFFKLEVIVICKLLLNMTSEYL